MHDTLRVITKTKASEGGRVVGKEGADRGIFLKGRGERVDPSCAHRPCKLFPLFLDTSLVSTT